MSGFEYNKSPRRRAEVVRSECMNGEALKAVERVPLSGTLPHPFLVTPLQYRLYLNKTFTPTNKHIPTPMFKSCAHTAVGASSKS